MAMMSGGDLFETNIATRATIYCRARSRHQPDAELHHKRGTTTNQVGRVFLLVDVETTAIPIRQDDASNAPSCRLFSGLKSSSTSQAFVQQPLRDVRGRLASVRL